MGLSDRPYMRAPSSGQDKYPHSFDTTLRPARSAKPRILVTISISIAAFVAIKAFGLLTPPLKIPIPPPAVAPTVRPPALQDPLLRYRPYLEKIAVPSIPIRTLAYEKIKGCPPGDLTCAAIQLYRFVQKDLGYIRDPAARELIQSPDETLRVGAGDCEDLAILLASLLENVGMPTYLVFTSDHAYTLACNVDIDQVRPTMSRLYTSPRQERRMQETHSIPSHSFKSWHFSFPEATALHYSINATQSVDWVLVPSKDDTVAFGQNKPYQSYLCSRDRVSQILEDECSVSGEPEMIIRNRQSQAVQVKINLRYLAPSQPPSLPDAIELYPINGQSCLVLDPAIKGAGYPGQTMPQVKTAAQITAVNRAGQRIELAYRR
jgi:hypothetical protein